MVGRLALTQKIVVRVHFPEPSNIAIVQFKLERKVNVKEPGCFRKVISHYAFNSIESSIVKINFDIFFLFFNYLRNLSFLSAKKL